jgi:hypothetical protein
MQGAYNGTRRPALPEGCRVGGDVVERVEALLDVPQHRQEVLLRVRWVEIRGASTGGFFVCLFGLKTYGGSPCEAVRFVARP